MKAEELLLAGERLDDLQRSGLSIIQNPKRFCFGMDAVLLSGFIAQAGTGRQSKGVREQKPHPLEGARVLDLGTGTGILPLLLSAKTGAAHITGLELQAPEADMAARSVRLNGLEEKITILRGDVREADRLFAAASFDVVASNPPYMIAGHGQVNPQSPKAIARHELFCTFEDIARQAARLLSPRGSLFLVHRPFRLSELCVTLTRFGLEPKRMRLVHPHADGEPNMVLLQAVKGGKPRMRVEKPLVVYAEDGAYTKELREVYVY